MTNPSKVKGNANENAIAKILSNWWGSEFKRTPNSGALRWEGVAWTYGDILPPEGFPAVLEAKHYKDVDTDAIIRTKATGGNILGWWKEVRADALRAYQEAHLPVQPILIYRQNRLPRRIALEADLFIALGGRNLKLPTFWITHPDHDSFVILDFELFLTVVTPELFLRACRKVIPAALVEHIAA